jgi:hypothetical protein
MTMPVVFLVAKSEGLFVVGCVFVRAYASATVRV